MRSRLFIWPVAIVSLVAMSGVLSAHTAGIVVAPSNAGVTQIALNIPQPPTITQCDPFGDTVTTSTPHDVYVDQLKVAGSQSPVTFAVTLTSPFVSVSSDGTITTTDQALTVGSYVIAGTESNAHHVTGNWSFTLTVANSGDQPHENDHAGRCAIPHSH